MKTKYIISLLLTISFMLSSCREVNVKTKVNSDGSFSRIITVSGDSSGVVRMDFPYPIDSTWITEMSRDTIDSTQFIRTYTRHYRNDDLLQQEIKNDTGWWRKIERSIEISKRFRFFYSFVSYKEIYKAANPSTLLDYRDYLSNEDLQWISGRIPLSKNDSLILEEIGKKIESYTDDTFVEEFIFALQNGLQNIDDPSVQSIDVGLYRDSIQKYVFSKLLAGEGDYEKQMVQSFDMLAQWTQNKKVLQLHKVSPPVFEDLLNKIEMFELLLNMENFSIEVEMPGLITETNSYNLIGNTVRWRVDNDTFYFEDLEMYVESRVVNYWAFVLSGIIVLLLLIALIVKLLK